VRTRSLLQRTVVLVETVYDKQDVQVKLTRCEWVAGKKKGEVVDREAGRY